MVPSMELFQISWPCHLKSLKIVNRPKLTYDYLGVSCCNNFTRYNQGINKLWNLYIIFRHFPQSYLVWYRRLKYKLNSLFDMRLLKYLSRNYFALIKLHQNLLDFSNRLTNNRCSSQTQSQTGPAIYFTGAWHLSNKDELSTKQLFQYILGLERPSGPEVLKSQLQ